jgi:hypothetical protein
VTITTRGGTRPLVAATVRERIRIERKKLYRMGPKGWTYYVRGSRQEVEGGMQDHGNEHLDLDGEVMAGDR